VIALVACSTPDLGKIKVAITPEHVAAVNALVPAELRAKIEFELQTIVDSQGRRTADTYKVAAPKGWKPAFLPASLQPADADDFGRSPAFGGAVLSFRVGSNCNGECTTKDWATEVEIAFYRKFTDGTASGKVVRDDRHATGRTLVFRQDDGEINLMTTWWKQGGSQHFICEARLDAAAAALAPAFEKACTAVSAE
jgi:hypothetical protein